MMRGSARRLVHLHSHPGYHGHLFSQAEPKRLAVAISSQTGSGAIRIAARLAVLLDLNGPSTNCPWQPASGFSMAQLA